MHFSNQFNRKIQFDRSIKVYFTPTRSFWLHKKLNDVLESYGLLEDYFISCLISHSDGTHSLQVDPLVSKWRDATFLQTDSKKVANASTSCMTWESEQCQQMFSIWENYSFNGARSLKYIF